MKVLINGGGIAGLSLATFLSERGVTPIVIERAPSFLAQGHIIALKAAGVAVLDRLGVRAACTQRALPSSIAMQAFTAGGYRLREQTSAGMAGALGGYLMLRRADLAAALYAHVRDRVEVRFGTQVRSFQQDGAGVEVRLSSGSSERADILVGADGVHSAIRHQLFGEQGQQRLGGSYLAIEVRCPHEVQVGHLQMYLGRGQHVALIPTGTEQLLVMSYNATAGLREKLRTPREARLFFAREYAGFAPQVRAVLAAVEDDSFLYVDDIKMIELPTLVQGRVALLGDAGTCPSFLSGMGSANAMLAAEQLAAALAEADGAAAGAAADAAESVLARQLSRYDEEARALSQSFRQNALGAARIILSRSRALGLMRDALLAAVPQALFLQRMRQLFVRKSAAA